MSFYRKRSNRRNFLAGMGALTVTSLPQLGLQSYPTRLLRLRPNYPDRDFSVKGDRSLHARATSQGLIYGAFPAFYYEDFAQDQQLQAAFLRECSLLVAGFYWGITRPSETEFDFTATDAFANFASEHNLLFRGHPLVWNQINPQWLVDKLGDSETTCAEAEQVLTKHISTVVRRYAGKVHSWDVVNEAISPEDGRADGLAVTPWLEALGADYIEIAFRTAAEADPAAMLVYNDALLDYDTSDQDARRYFVLKLLERLKERNVPIHALGIQAHLLGHEPFVSSNKLRQFLQDVASLELNILVTELDVKDTELTADINRRDRIIASVYEDYLSVILQEPAVIAIITWGLSDFNTWLAEVTPRRDGLPLRPLPLDTNFNRKLAWNAMARAFDNSQGRKLS
jgi:endo-1,4-beta-xylanase